MLASLPSWPPLPSPARAPLLADLRETFVAQNEVVFGADLVPLDLVAAMYAEACTLERDVVRKVVPGIKKSGSVSYHALRENGAPTTLALYQSRAFIGWLEAITGRRLVTCPERDPHACALYFYTRAGDHVGWHYDHCHYRGERFTVLIALHDASSARLMVELRKPDHAPERLALATRPGSCVIFNGARLHHAVSPLGAGERRVMLTLEYVTDRRMTRWRRFVSGVKDAFGYFGVRQWLFGPRRRRHHRRAPAPERVSP